MRAGAVASVACGSRHEKPFLVDVDNPLLVEMLLKTSKKGQLLSVSEMLPSADDLWMPDHRGRRYSCEFSVCTVDPS